MPYFAPQIAIVDSIGQAFCMDCADRATGDTIKMHGDESSLNGDHCDGCGKIFQSPVPSKDWILGV